MGTLTKFHTDAQFPVYPRTETIEDTYWTTVDTLEKATDLLDKCSQGILDLHLIPESSRPEFGEVRGKLTEKAQIYTSLHFPLAVSVVRDVQDVFNSFAAYVDIKKLKKKKLKAMEKTISEHATNSADSSLVHNILLKELYVLQVDLRKKSDTLTKDAGKMRETRDDLRQEIEEKKALYTSMHDDYIAQKKRHRKEKVQHNAETSQAAALVVKHSEDVIVREREAQEARDKKENAASEGTFGTVASAVGVVTMTGSGTVIGALGAATVLSGGLLVGGAAVLGAGAYLLTNAKLKEREAEGDEKLANVEGSIARESGVRAAVERDRAAMERDRADEKMRKAAQDAAQVEAEKSKEIFKLQKESRRAEQGAEECDYTVRSLSSVIDPLEQFAKAMEKLSEFLSGLGKDINSCLEEVGEVRLGRENGRQRMKHHFEQMQKHIGQVQSRCDKFENFRGVVQTRIDALTAQDAPASNAVLHAQDAPASNAKWIQDHQDRKDLTPPEGQRIRVRLDLPSPYHITFLSYQIPAFGCFRRSIAHS